MAIVRAYAATITTADIADKAVTQPKVDLSSTDDTNLVLETTGTDTDKPPAITFSRASTTVADDMEIGTLSFRGQNSAGEEIEYGSIVATASDVTDADEGGQLSIYAFGGGTGGTASSIEALRIGQERVAGSAQAFQAVFLNPSSGDCDVVMHGDGTSNMFRLNAGDDRIGIGAFPDEASAILEIETTTKGFLPPRMNTTQQNAISSPTNGLVIYNTTTNKLMVYNGSWTALH
jgi:hypothetical protein|tara:strand:+ start:1097 stop:1795 length:699 start_codon:yes stop_codon:yes gene_type:complete